MLSLTHYWYKKNLNLFFLFLLPFSFLFKIIVLCRRMLYRLKLLKTTRLPVPVIVVGNITVGGTGKTPLVIWLANFLIENGYQPGIVSRGVGGRKHYQPRWVSSRDDPHVVGDEALLLVNGSACPVVIGIDRVAAAKHLLRESACNVIISDDGLQHYRLERDVEIIMVDGKRRFGNQRLLPAGPLREPVARLKEADVLVINQGDAKDTCVMSIEPSCFVSLMSGQKQSCATWKGKGVHAVAGIGHPQQFFALLTQLGLDVQMHVFPDHHHYKKNDLSFADDLPVVMTEKDAVKCHRFAQQHYWFLKVSVKMPDTFKTFLIHKLKSLEDKNETFPNANRQFSHTL